MDLYIRMLKNKKKKSRISPSVTTTICALVILIGGFFLSYNYIQAKKIMAYDYMANVFYTSNTNNIIVDDGTRNNEEETVEEEDDLELVAVIAAAIAASEGTDPNGLVVRSIKRVGKTNNWKRA